MSPLEKPASRSARGRHFFWRLYLSYTGMVVVSAAFIGAFVLGNLKENAVREVTSGLLGTARLLAATEAANPAHLWSASLNEQVADVADDTGLHLTYVLSNGRVLARTPGVEEPADSALAWPEIQAARRARSGIVRRATGGSTEHLFVAVPILLEYEIIGYVRVGVPLISLAARERSLTSRVIFGATLSAFAALGLGYVFARNVTRPLEHISAVCRDIAAGKLDERVALRRTDEIGVVATTVNQMASELQRRIADESRERQRLATLLSEMTDGVVAVSARKTIAYLNIVAARLLGIGHERAIGAPFPEQARLTAVVAVYEEALRIGARVPREVRITGHPHDQVLAVYATPLRDADGTPRGALVVLHDLTEIRRLEEVRQKFSTNVSHELKTPLTAIGSLVDALIEDVDMAPASRDRFLQRIRDQNERLQKLVQDLLTISRLESAGDVLELTVVHAGALVSPCLKTFGPVAQQKGVRLELHSSNVSLWICVNAEAGRLIVNNLLHNAVNYTPAGGTVTVTVVPHGDEVAIEVRDTGIGIAPEQLERIFERFYRVDPSRSRRGGGVGLGLSIVKHLTGAMGGRVLVESTLGRGSVFTVQFQAASAPGGARFPV